MKEVNHKPIGIVHPEFDQRKAERIGWLNKNVDKMHSNRDDGRFVRNVG